MYMGLFLQTQKKVLKSIFQLAENWFFTAPLCIIQLLKCTFINFVRK